MEDRVAWEELPGALRDEVRGRAGQVTRAESVTAGLNSPATYVLSTTGGGRLFFKGVRRDDACGVRALRAEEAVAEVVAGVSPGIRHRFEVAGWYCLAFVHVAGSHVDLSPGTRDLDALTATLTRMQRFSVGGGVPAGRHVVRETIAGRLAGFLRGGEAELLAGPALLHTDTHPFNIIISEDEGRAYVVDWAMPATGPAWVDVANTAVRLMECGQSPEFARAWLRRFPVWAAADPRAVEAYVRGTCRQWAARVGEAGALAGNQRFLALCG
ncbi:phosphotransferase family protein [Streptomyces albidoflavus]